MIKLLLMFAMLSLGLTSFSQGFKNTDIRYKNGIITDYTFNGDTVYSVGEKLIVGQPVVNRFLFVQSIGKSVNIVSGDSIVIERFSLKGNYVMAWGLINNTKHKCIIDIKSAIKHKELLSYDMAEKTRQKTANK